VSAPRIILGLDPGIALFGYGVIAAVGDALTHLDHGCIVTPAHTPTPARLRTLYEGLIAVTYRFPVTDVAVEALFYARNVSTAMAVGQARGVALLVAALVDARFGEYTPNEVKQAVTGFGGARKRQMQEMIQLVLGLPALPQSDDAADALAIAVCHARRAAFDAAVLRSQAQVS
jgi:crossover junction endodeoxyribonuclease RuvC